jgi:hypothetical protein
LQKSGWGRLVRCEDRRWVEDVGPEVPHVAEELVLARRQCSDDVGEFQDERCFGGVTHGDRHAVYVHADILNQGAEAILRRCADWQCETQRRNCAFEPAFRAWP